MIELLTKKLPKIYLASSSPRRKALLEQIGLRFEIIKPETDETPLPGEQPDTMVMRLAREKAQTVWHSHARNENHPVLAADTIVVHDGDILCKPADKEQALSMLKKLSGSMHLVLTGLAVLQNDRLMQNITTTKVFFRELTEAECEAYWESGEPKGKAGAYAIQGLGALFIERIDGDYSNIVGLPLLDCYQLLLEYC